MARKKKRYIALIDCRNDKTGKRFKVGDLVTDSDFKRAVIQNWLGIGVLKPEAVKDGGNN